MNSWNFTGNLGRDAETRYNANGTPVVNFSVAVKAGYGEHESTTWARCAMFGKRGEAVAPYLTKGQQVGVSGEVAMKEWTDRDGMKRVNLEVRVNDLTLLGSRDGGQQSAQEPRQHRQEPARKDAGGIEDIEDDIPF